MARSSLASWDWHAILASRGFYDSGREWRSACRPPERGTVRLADRQTFTARSFRLVRGAKDCILPALFDLEHYIIRLAEDPRRIDPPGVSRQGSIGIYPSHFLGHRDLDGHRNHFL